MVFATPCEAIAWDAVTVHLAYSPDVATGSSLHSTGRTSVGVAVKPPDELSQARNRSSRPPTPSALPHTPILGGCSKGIRRPQASSLLHTDYRPALSSWPNSVLLYLNTTRLVYSMSTFDRLYPNIASLKACLCLCTK